MTRDDAVKIVQDKLPPHELLTQLAEELTEAAQAALKLRRAAMGVNPTPVDCGQARRKLLEELRDVGNIVETLGLVDAVRAPGLDEYADGKMARWARRLGKTEAE